MAAFVAEQDSYTASTWTVRFRGEIGVGVVDCVTVIDGRRIAVETEALTEAEAEAEGGTEDGSRKEVGLPSPLLGAVRLDSS
jgi:hypothetical protein